MKLKRYLSTIWVLSKLLTRRNLRSKTALFFGVLFPLVLLFVFGGIFGSSSGTSFNVTVIDRAQTEFSRNFVSGLDHNKVFKVKPTTSIDAAKTQLERSSLDAIIELPANFGKANGQGFPGGQVVVLYSQNSAQAGQTVASILDAMLGGLNSKLTRITPPFTAVSQSTGQAGLTAFDYTFTGLLGFTLLGIGIFGPINTLPALKKNGSLARLRTTPLRPLQFIAAYMISSLVPGAISIAIQFAVAIGIFHFHINGNVFLFALYALLAAIMIFGFGMAVGGWANDEKQSAPLGNLVTFPMMFLSGIFFPRYLMPEWLQHVSSLIPLSPVVDGLRMIATEHKGILDLGPQLGIMAGWMVIIYIVAFRVFRWQ